MKLILWYVQKYDLIYLAALVLLYGIFLLGFWMVYQQSILAAAAKLKMKNRLKARRKAMNPEPLLDQHLRKLLVVSLQRPMEPKTFQWGTFFLFLVVLAAGIHTIALPSAFLIAALLASMPYLLLRVRIEAIRRKSSYEGEALITEFLCQYRVCQCNIYQTIEQVVLHSEGTKTSGKLLYKMLLELRKTGNSKKMKVVTDQFSYGIHTGWSRMLANCIFLSAESGMNVTLALEDILIQLRDARILYEERKRMNSESVRIVIFLAPVMYIGTMLLSVKYLGISWSKLLRNQVYTEQGFLLLLLILFLFLVNLVLIEIIQNQRFDY